MNKILIYFFTSLLMLTSVPGQGQSNYQYTYWTELTGEYLVADYPLFDVCFVNPDTGFVVGGIMQLHASWGEVQMTKDGGFTWTTIINTNETGNQCPVFCHFLNRSKGYIVSSGVGIGGDRQTYETLDGGISWVRDSIIRFHEIFTINDTLSWALGRSGGYDKKILRTLDGGKTWNQYYNMPEECLGDVCDLRSIFFIDSITGYGVGEKGLIMKFLHPDSLEIISNEISLPLNKVFFSSLDHGWIAGGYRNTWDDTGGDDAFMPVFFRTEDGGENWTEVPGLDYLIHDFYFEDTIHGWAVGENSKAVGCMLETFDSGFTWELTGLYYEGALHALHMKDGVGWAVGDNGVILRTGYNSNTTADQDNFIEEGNELRLWNYPNPFHSRTIISYQSIEISNIELSIYDLSGRKVSSLIKENMPAGIHETEWNTENAEPGIYFCELNTSQGRQVIIMIVLD